MEIAVAVKIVTKSQMKLLLYFFWSILSCAMVFLVALETWLSAPG